LTRDREPIRAGGIGSAVARDGAAAGAGDARDYREGSYLLSRNPSYVGLLALYLGLALLAPTFWGLVLFPAAVLLVLWGAIHPEERFLHERFGAPYDDYTRRVRRWL
jgi:protein-S-isoprenylcysteine O-methyltransferase Ste14